MCCSGVQGGNPAGGFHQMERYPCSKTKFGSNPWDGLVRLLRERQRPVGAESKFTKFQARAVGVFILAVQIEILSKEFNSRFFLKINLAENLEIIDV